MAEPGHIHHAIDYIELAVTDMGLGLIRFRGRFSYAA